MNKKHVSAALLVAALALPGAASALTVPGGHDGFSAFKPNMPKAERHVSFTGGPGGFERGSKKDKGDRNSFSHLSGKGGKDGKGKLSVALGDHALHPKGNGWQPRRSGGKGKEDCAPVPLPAAAWLLLGGIGALGAASRRKRTA